MPSSLFADSGVQGDALDDQRALQIALDQLSLLGLDNDENPLYDNNQEPRKKSVNMTECVPVPSSEHVAEIVGRQGCKIKALRAKTNTYIKTPVRGEEPVFVVTGRREDVAMARREIISAAEHFSMIRASRNKNTSLNGSGTPVPGPPNLPGQTTIQVRVPYRVVGLVVGPKGATIKRIQQQTHTYIVTPSRDKEPVFEVTGMPENVDRAREEIELTLP
ncbi:RNA-binding protein MEX3B [Lates japonicus]